jgi:uncharacterized protein YodC (DUF2158 family)
MSNTFKIGDVVQIRSGGPEMVVTRLYPAKVDCLWYSVTFSKYEERAFEPVALKLVTAAESGAKAQTSSTAAPKVDETAGEPAIRVDWSA